MPDKTYTIVRNGTIKLSASQLSSHRCGFSRTRRYPYRVTISVSGELQSPQRFIVANELIDERVQATFKTKRSESCEAMADDICVAMHALMQEYPQWRVRHIHVELTGTNGLALLSCDWRDDSTVAA